jgi:hypothetical protein
MRHKKSWASRQTSNLNTNCTTAIQSSVPS